ncbi:class I glutamine amidotransferase-like protein [Russula brevipes]|nr:class I glutamine amidotransferase-like protein [Russula brevipes]
MPSALILIANGSEEMEFTITYDTLVRAGVKCTSALITPPGESGGEGPSQGEYDAIIIPGGLKGAETMSQSPLVQSLVKSFYDSGKVVGMICAASIVAKTSQLPRQPLTSHPSVKERLDEDFEYGEDSVVTSGNLITSHLTSLGTAFPFAFTLVERLCGAQKRSEVVGPMIFPSGTAL